MQEVARQCLSTLVSLHKNGVIHCDLVRHAPIRSLALVRPVHLPCRSPAHSCLLFSRVQKPENILIESLTTCKIKVIDYGNAYLHHDQRCSYVQSRAYRAPEERDHRCVQLQSTRTSEIAASTATRSAFVSPREAAKPPQRMKRIAPA